MDAEAAGVDAFTEANFGIVVRGNMLPYIRFGADDVVDGRRRVPNPGVYAAGLTHVRRNGDGPAAGVVVRRHQHAK
jgi:hypothetical protein